MRIVLACGAASLALATVASAQDANIHETVFRYRKSLSKIEGVLDVTVAAVNGEQRVLVRVASTDAKEAIEQLVGKKLDGFPLHVHVTTVAAPPEPKSAPSETVAEPPRKQPSKTEAQERSRQPFDECDIVNEGRKNDGKGRCAWTRVIKWTSPGVVERVGNGADHRRPNKPATIPGSTGWHAGEGVGTTWSTVVARHRKTCPIAMAETVRRVLWGLRY